MLNINGNLVENETVIRFDNRGFNYGDALFETIKIVNGKILFWEDHYFRLMASMRILRMEIPMNFTMEFLEAEIFKLLETFNSSPKAYRVKLIVNRVEGGLYAPESNSINYLISAKPLLETLYLSGSETYEVDLFKDFYITPGLLSTIKSNNKVINVVGSIYGKENGLQNCLLINTDKKVVEALNGNLFLVKDNILKTPPLEDGCLKGVMRKQIIELLENSEDYEIKQESISPFELQKADELFITNVIMGIVSITKYRKKAYLNTVAYELTGKLNDKINKM